MVKQTLHALGLLTEAEMLQVKLVMCELQRHNVKGLQVSRVGLVPLMNKQGAVTDTFPVKSMFL